MQEKANQRKQEAESKQRQKNLCQYCPPEEKFPVIRV